MLIGNIVRRNATVPVRAYRINEVVDTCRLTRQSFAATLPTGRGNGRTSANRLLKVGRQLATCAVVNLHTPIN